MSSNGDTVPVPTTASTATTATTADASPPATEPLTPHRRWLSILSAIMIVLGCVLVPVTATSFWVRDDHQHRLVCRRRRPLASDPWCRLPSRSS